MRTGPNWPRLLFVLCLTCLGFILLSNSCVANAAHLSAQRQKEFSKSLLLYSPEFSSAFQDPDASNIIIVSTVDGLLHGVDITNGKILWTLDERSSGDKHTPGKDKLRKDGITLTEGQQVGEEVKNEDINQELPTYTDFEEDEVKEEPRPLHQVFVVEPAGQGNLYMFEPGKSVKKLSLSVKQLVDMSPFRVSDGSVYLGSKSTKFYAIHPRTGKILHIFSNDDLVQDACPKDMNIDAIYIGKTDYKLANYDVKTRKQRWNITFSEYSASSFDGGLRRSDNEGSSQISGDKKDDILVKILASHDGRLLIHRKNDDEPLIVQFQTPAISTFAIEGQPYTGLQLIKAYPPTPKTPTKALPGSQVQSAYIGHFKGSLYALSSETFPDLLGIDPPAKRLELPYPSEIAHGENECQNDENTFRSCLSGSYAIEVLELVQSDIKSLPPGMDRPIAGRKRLVMYGALAGMSILGTIWFFWRKFNKPKLRWTRPKVRSRPKGNKENHNNISNNINNNNNISNNNIDSLKNDMNYGNNQGNGNAILGTSSAIIPFDESNAVNGLKKRRRRKKLVEPYPNNTNLTNTQKFNDSPSTEETHKKDIPPTAVVTEINGVLHVNSLSVSQEILGYGSHGTVVYKGTFQGRDVAIKRLLLDFYDVAHHEVKLLQESDDHPNVIRYFCKEVSDRFMYVALELCPASLFDVIEKTTPDIMDLRNSLDSSQVLSQITQGIGYLHSLKIVHRDIKPQNILITRSTKSPHPRILISDFGLSKKLSGDQSSFHNTLVSAGGTVGWRAPECMTESSIHTTDSESSALSLHPNSSDHQSDKGIKITRAIDIFSCGCVFYYVLSNGDHPFGARYDRESNILKECYSLNRLREFGEEGVEAVDLIEKMIRHNPKERPTAATIMTHPYFWTPSLRLQFLLDVSDRFEIENRDPPSDLLLSLEKVGKEVFGGADWSKKCDRTLLENLGKYRRYDTKSLQHLLRAMRNKKHHYQDLPDHAKKLFGSIPEGFLSYFTSRFPKLLLKTYYLIDSNETLRNETVFVHYKLTGNWST